MALPKQLSRLSAVILQLSLFQEPISEIPYAAMLANFSRHKKRRRKCIGDTLRRSDTVTTEIGRIPKGCGYFLAPLCYDFVVVATATTSLPRLADARKSLATRLWCIFEIGSSPFRNFFFSFYFYCTDVNRSRFYFFLFERRSDGYYNRFRFN